MAILETAVSLKSCGAFDMANGFGTFAQQTASSEEQTKPGFDRIESAGGLHNTFLSMNAGS